MEIGKRTGQKVYHCELGHGSTAYVVAAQEHIDAGNIQECLRIIRSGIENGAEPKDLLVLAHQNAINGVKKLAAVQKPKVLPAHQKANAKQNSIAGEHKSGIIQNENSQIFKLSMRLKNLRTPIPQIKNTPKKTDTQKLCLKRLKESPMIPPKWNQSPFAKVKLDVPEFSLNVDASKGHLPEGRILKEKEDMSQVGNESASLGHSDESRFKGLPDKENHNPFLSSITEPSLHSKHNRIDSGSMKSYKTIQYCPNAIKSSAESLQTKMHAADKKENCKGTDMKMPHGIANFDVGDIIPRYEDKDQTTDALSCTESLSDSWTYTSITDPNFLSEKLRTVSESGFQDFISGSIAVYDTPLKKTQTEESLANKKGTGCIQHDAKAEKDWTGNMKIVTRTKVSDSDELSSPEQVLDTLATKTEKSGLEIKSTKAQIQVMDTRKGDLTAPSMEYHRNVADGVNFELRESSLSEQGGGQTLEEMCGNGSVLQRWNLSGIAELENLSLSDDRQTSSTASSRTIVSAAALESAPMLSSNTSTLSTKTITASASHKPAQPFKMPSAPAPKVNQPDSARTLGKNGNSLQVTEEFKGQPTASATQELLGISNYLMKKRHDAETAKSLSTTKKHKLIRIKKERYKVVSILGKGGSGKVYEVENDDGKIFAMKCVPLEDLDDFVFKSHCNEIEILWTLRNDPYIIKLFEYEIKNEKLFMLMERGDMDLEKYLHLNRKMGCDEIRNLWTQMLCAVGSIHKQGIIHTDLKPANFLFVDSSLKLIDFGIAKGLQENCTSTQRDCLIGTLNYMAPESVSETTYDRAEYCGSKKNYKIRRATDIWSLGCILYLMVYGKTPFQHIQSKALKVAAITVGRDIAFPEIDDEDLLDTIKGCLQSDPSQRYTIDQLLAHPFVSKGQSQKAVIDGDCAYDSFSKRDHKDFFQHVKHSSVNSPNSLQRAQKCMTRRDLFEQNAAPNVRKAIF